MRIRFTTIVASLLMLAAEPSFAQPTSEREATAEDLFQRGKERMAAHDVAKACTLFAESYRLDAAGGTLQNLAICYEELGRWASAYARFEELRTRSKNATPPRGDRVAMAEEHLAVLRPRVSRLFIVVPEESRARGMVVKVDGVAYEDIARTEGIVVDPGAHEVEVSAPEKMPFKSRVDVAKEREATRAEVRVPPLAAATQLKLGSTAAQHPTRPIGIVVGAVGVAALGAGGLVALFANDANSSGKDKCLRATNPSAPADQFDANGHCLEKSQALTDANLEKDRAGDLANIANVLVPVGVIGLAVGAYLFLREAHGQDKPRARLTPGLNGARLEVRF